jgi:hypothetical protein
MKIKLKVSPQSLMHWPYGNELGQHDPTEEEIKAAYEKGDFDDRVMDDSDVLQAIHLEAMKASNNGQDKDSYCKVWKTYHAKRTAYWMNEMRLKPASWQKNEAHPLTVKLIASAGNHRARAAKMMNLAPIEVVIESGH